MNYRIMTKMSFVSDFFTRFSRWRPQWEKEFRADWRDCISISLARNSGNSKGHNIMTVDPLHIELYLKRVTKLIGLKIKRFYDLMSLI